MKSKAQKIDMYVHFDTSELEEVARKAKHVNELLEKASSIIDELASKKEISLPLKVES